MKIPVIFLLKTTIGLGLAEKNQLTFWGKLSYECGFELNHCSTISCQKFKVFLGVNFAEIGT